MQRPGGITYHQAPALGAPDVEGVLEHRPPRDPRRVAEAEERQRRLGEDRDRDDQHRVGEDQRQRVGEDVRADDVGVAGARAPGRARRRRARAGSAPGRGRSARCPAHEVSPMTDDQDGQRRVEQARQDDHQRQRRDDQEPVLERVEAAVGPAAEVAADEPDVDPRTAEISAAAKPTTIETRAPTRICEKTSEPFSVVPRMWSDARRREHVEARGVRVVGRDRRCRRSRRRRTAPSDREPEAPAPGAEQQVADARLGSSRNSGCASTSTAAPACSPLIAGRPLIATAPAGRGRSTGSRRSGWPGSPRPRRRGTSPASTGKSLSLIAWKLSSPRPGHEKIVSIVIAPPDDRAELDRRQRHQRQQRVRHRVAADDPLPRQPGRPLDGDEVLGQHVDHRRAHDQEVLAEQHQRHRGRRQDQVLGDVRARSRTSWRTRPRASPAVRSGRSVSRPRRRGSG